MRHIRSIFWAAFIIYTSLSCGRGTQNLRQSSFLDHSNAEGMEQTSDALMKQMKEKFAEIIPEEYRTEETIHAMALLEIKCGSCHGAQSSGLGNFNYVSDIVTLIQKGKVLPGQSAEASLLFARIEDNTMPPAGSPKLSGEDIAFLRDWIENKLESKSFVYDFEKSPEEICQENGNRSIQPRRLWRLTREQIENSINDIFSLNLNIAEEFNLGTKSVGFSNNAELNRSNPSFLASLARVADMTSAAAAQKKGELLSCPPDNISSACISEFISRTGTLVFRRHLTTEQRAELQNLYNTVASSIGTDYAFQALIQAMIMSPRFVYRQETGIRDGSFYLLDSYETAAALSFAITNSTPSSALLEQARKNGLSSKQQIRLAAISLLTDPKARQGLRQFFSELLQFERFGDLTKTGAYDGILTAALKRDLQEETLSFLSQVFLENKGSLRELYSANYTFLNNNLAKHYGYDLPGIGSAFTKVDSKENSYGLLSQGSIMTLHASADGSSPIKRGRFVREQLLCQTLPAPPEGLVPELPEMTSKMTTRERFTVHMENASCKGCHQLIDPIGFGFENFDGLGRFRLEENGSIVDSRGEIINGGDISQKFHGPDELAKLLGESKLAASCITTNFFRYTMGRENLRGDRCEIAKVNHSFFESDMTFREMFLSMFESDLFRYRK